MAGICYHSTSGLYLLIPGPVSVNHRRGVIETVLDKYVELPYFRKADARYFEELTGIKCERSNNPITRDLHIIYQEISKGAVQHSDVVSSAASGQQGVVVMGRSDVELIVEDIQVPLWIYHQPGHPSYNYLSTQEPVWKSYSGVKRVPKEVMNSIALQDKADSYTKELAIYRMVDSKVPGRPYKDFSIWVAPCMTCVSFRYTHPTPTLLDDLGKMSESEKYAKDRETARMALIIESQKNAALITRELRRHISGYCPICGKPSNWNFKTKNYICCG